MAIAVKAFRAGGATELLFVRGPLSDSVRVVAAKNKKINGGRGHGGRSPGRRALCASRGTGRSHVAMFTSSSDEGVVSDLGKDDFDVSDDSVLGLRVGEKSDSTVPCVRHRAIDGVSDMKQVDAVVLHRGIASFRR